MPKTARPKLDPIVEQVASAMKPDARRRLKAFFRNPSVDTWGKAATLVVPGRARTLWQIWADEDPFATRLKPLDGVWPSIPDPKMLAPHLAVPPQTPPPLAVVFRPRLIDLW